ncbi:MAG: hypothetical protein LUC33_03585 [Prevotellaceae bacterium]|nr:hypothetical protein [Prevotellaceae bacterium]
MKTNKTFRELCKEAKAAPTPLKALISKAMEATGKNERTVRNWAAGAVRPGKGDIEALAKALDAEPDTLF